jgi:hypothetical protein
MSKKTEVYPELPDFEKLPPIYDAVYENIHDWAQDRTVEDTEYSSAAKGPVIPFAPLTREIGVSPVEDVETREMTLDYQQQISNWVGLVKSPFDLIQRAQGQETPEKIYYGGQNKAAKNQEDPRSRAITRSSSGRKAIRREYDTTLMHSRIANERAQKATIGLTHLRDGQGFTTEERHTVIEILQELANGLAANLDDKFPGGDMEARIAGNSILGVAEGIERGTINPDTQKRLLYAAIGYIKKQEKKWDNKLKRIYDFAAEKGFSVGQNSDEQIV